MKATAILCADIHIRADSPKARTDDFHAAMWAKWSAILKLAHENDNCPVLVAGDLGERAEWPNWLLERFINEWMAYEVPVLAIPGQHDLPGHNLDMLERSALGVLDAAGVVTVMVDDWLDIGNNVAVQPFPYGTEMQGHVTGKKYNVAMAHQLVTEGAAPEWKGQAVNPGKALLKKFPEYNLIITGDNHKPFTVKYEGRVLANPGSMMRTTADQIGHRPRVYKWWAETNECAVHYLPIKRGVISREHLEVQAEKDKRMEAFVRSVKNRKELKLSFEDNMEAHLTDNPAPDGVVGKIWAAMEG